MSPSNFDLESIFLHVNRFEWTAEMDMIYGP